MAVLVTISSNQAGWQPLQETNLSSIEPVKLPTYLFASIMAVDRGRE